MCFDSYVVYFVMASITPLLLLLGHCCCCCCCCFSEKDLSDIFIPNACLYVCLCNRMCGKDVNMKHAFQASQPASNAREIDANAKNINYKDIKPKSRIIHVIRHGTHTAKVSRKIWVMPIEPKNVNMFQCHLFGVVVFFFFSFLFFFLWPLFS